MKKERFDIVLLIVTIITGIGIYLLDSALFHSLEGRIPYCVLIGLLYAILYVAVVVITSFIRNFSAANDPPGGGLGGFLLIFLISLPIVFGIGTLFQYLYSLEPKITNSESTSLIFLIDDSGSMDVSDPQGVRYEVLDEILKEYPEDFQYAIYGFNDEIYSIRNMAPKNAGNDFQIPQYGGSTEIRHSLDYLIDEIESGNLNGGDNPQVILLSDGAATDIGIFHSINKTLKKYNKNRVVISTVGLGQYVVSEQLYEIADSTGGVYVNASDVSQLKQAYEKAKGHSNSTRHLYGYRRPKKADALAAVTRILFLTIMGGIIGIAGAVCCFYNKRFSFSAICGVITAFIGSLLMELGTQVFGASPSFMWLLMWILFAMVISFKLKIKAEQINVGIGNDVGSWNSNPGNSNNIIR